MTTEDIDDVSRTWTKLGREDPMWAVLTDKGKDRNRWSAEDFLATGVDEISTVMARLGALGLDVGRERALDFGCGAGRLSHGLAGAGFGEVLGCDISPTMLDKAREIVPDEACRFVQVTGSDLAAVESDSVDLVYCCRVLQHMPPALAHGYVREFWRVARPGGVVVFQIPTEPSSSAAGRVLSALPVPVARLLRRGMEMHATSEADVRRLAESAGAQVVVADPDTSAGPRWESCLYVTTPG
ncbi:class I SAM-dependent methyltransferase [Actinomycetospora endophytica]|uniref:Class I SAM-dependent methyltransferase n=1 Tax=Actinomycetospora endophytica TaxID=2291215 RepID=A0ABS8P4Y5_9PSEU|nr:class I SAM-dependent methyltransferase [Actinomycetospora endophytica]MCD2193317.1 class I SAM-dependent methyltransferase [Actinomycetospora endophytica]